MKTSDIFTRPIIQLTKFASIDVSKFLHAPSANGSHFWTFAGPGSNEWICTRGGTFNEASRKAVRAYTDAYDTKFVRLQLVGMEAM